MALDVHIDDQARDWLSAKGKELTVYILKAKGCCGGGPLELNTKLGQPDEPHLFDRVTEGECTIYVQKGIPTNDNRLRLKLSGFGLFKSISALGIARFQ